MGSNSLEELKNVSFKDILEQDSRPTFIIDLDPDDLDSPSKMDVLNPIFCNAALRSHELLLDTVTGEAVGGIRDTTDTTTYEEFKSWATGVTKFDDSMDVFPLSIIYSGMLWTGSTVRKRWRLISGNRCFQISGVASHDLSSGPLPEVATGGTALNGIPDKYGAGRVPPRQSTGLQDPSLRVNLSPTPSAKTPLVSSNQQQISKGPKVPSGSSNDTGQTASTTSITLAVPENGVPDWTASTLTRPLSPHVLFARNIDWASTPLGPIDSWSPAFRQVANLVMGNPHPAALFWGEELTMMYNEAYRDEVAGRKHPELMGTGFQGPFSELWDSVGPIFAECARTGDSVRKENQMLPIERHGYLEETFFSWSFTPLYGGTERILGFYNAPFETTIYDISNRRTQTLHRLGEKLIHARTVKEFWKSILEGLEENHFDVPFALLYSVVDVDDDEQSSSHSVSSGSMISLKSCIFEGSIAVSEGHPAAQQKLDLKRSGEGFIPSFREAMRTREPTNLQTRDGTLPEILLEGINWRGFKEPCREATIFPIRPTNGETVLAFLLVGINPRRAYDDEYKAFTTMLNRQLATSLASVMLFEDEICRSRNAAEQAALEQEQLSEQLAVQTSRLQRMTANSPLGMFYISPEGLILEANDRYYEMTGTSRDNVYEMSWLEHLVEGSKSTMEEGWHKLVVDRVPWSGELQLKKPALHSLDSNDEQIDHWVMATSQPEFASDGSLRSIMGSITDISHLKWAQGLQNRRLQEAEETRRQQNEFIDITSHEMRNPLSAILQCADDISSTLGQYKAKGVQPTATAIDDTIDAAKTIALCVQHQKSIVDDILTISKLDCNLLLITLVPIQPIAVAHRAVKMFDPELQSKDIKMEFRVGSSLQKLEVDWVALDPSRLLQVLINLMTNAIKFTQAQAKRQITLCVAASLSLPHENISGFQFIPPKNAKANLSFGEDWGPGELLYLYFEVQDSGCGLNADEKQVLFKRFSQATPRTHAQYGGSGLGLFISRQLTELHGGQIGVGSEAGVGSTFGFYIKGRRTTQPRGSTPQLVAPLVNDSQRHGSLDQMIPLEYDDQPSAPREATNVPTEQRPPIDRKELHVLVVEDNLVNQRILMKQLQKVGCTVAVACHGIEALAYLEKTEFRKDGGSKLSVILMDLEMPEMDGLTCVRVIRSMEAEGVIAKHVPVIAVTANVRQEQIEAAKGSGMDDVMLKPFRIPELLAKIETLLTS